MRWLRPRRRKWYQVLRVVRRRRRSCGLGFAGRGGCLLRLGEGLRVSGVAGLWQGEGWGVDGLQAAYEVAVVVAASRGQ